MIRTYNLTVETARLPDEMKAFSRRKGDSYYIVINEAETDDGRAAAFLHEALHIWHGDHDSGDDVDAIERERHEELKRLLSILN